VLLDTHVLWWLLQQPKKLGKNILSELSSSSLVLYSPMTVFELYQKAKKKKLNVPENLVELINQSGLQELQVNSHHAIYSRYISHQITNPIDCLLIAQAQAKKVDFYTSDSKILSLGLNFVKDASI
jgi:PIN domain nuclease of toxin-antitoxin system